LPSNRFDRMLLCAVEESLSSLGDSPKQAIFFHLENSFNIKKEGIPTNLTEFAKAIEGIFGIGAPYLEKLIAKRLCEKLGVSFEEMKDWDFLEYINAVQTCLSPEQEPSK